MKTPKPLPASIVKVAQIHRDAQRPWQLLIFLDGYTYAEVLAISKASFAKHLAAWKADTYPTLKRSCVRYFLVTPKTIDETTPTRL